MKKLFALALIVMTAFMGGCLTSDDDSKDDDGGNTGNGGTWKVFGYVKLADVNGAGIKDVSVKLVQNSKTQSTVSTNADGYFEFTKIANGTYTVVPSKSGYTFTPAEIANVVVADKDVVVQTFVGTTSGGTTDPGTGNAGASTYLPYKKGATWTYISKMTSDEYNDESTTVNTVLGTQSYSGKTYWAVEIQDINTYYTIADTTLYRIDGSTVYGFISLDLLAKPAAKTSRAAAAAKVAGVKRALVQAYGSEMTFYKFGLGSGQTWSILDTGAYAGFSYKITGKSLGTESVTVTAGSFSGCQKLEITSVMKSESDDEKYTSTSVSHIWFAPNVGIVKTDETSTDVDTTSQGTETTVYKYSDDLKTYSIP